MVTGIEVFDLTKDGCCPAKSPGNKKNSKNWKSNCGTTNNAAIHPYKKPTEHLTTRMQTPLLKIKALISAMIERRLESEAESDATEKEFCDKEL